MNNFYRHLKILNEIFLYKVECFFSSTAISSFKKNRGRPKKEPEDLSHLTSLDLDLDLDLDLEEVEDEEKEKTGERSPMKLSKILPKPTSSFKM